MSVLIITHDLGVVAETCDDVVVMHGGTICETANVFDIFDRPNHDIEVFACINTASRFPTQIDPSSFGQHHKKERKAIQIQITNYSGISRNSDTAEIGRDGPHGILKIEKLAMYFHQRRCAGQNKRLQPSCRRSVFFYH